MKRRLVGEDVRHARATGDMTGHEGRMREEDGNRTHKLVLPTNTRRRSENSYTPTTLARRVETIFQTIVRRNLGPMWNQISEECRDFGSGNFTYRQTKTVSASHLHCVIRIVLLVVLSAVYYVDVKKPPTILPSF